MNDRERDELAAALAIGSAVPFLAGVVVGAGAALVALGPWAAIVAAWMTWPG